MVDKPAPPPVLPDLNFPPPMEEEEEPPQAAVEDQEVAPPEAPVEEEAPPQAAVEEEVAPPQAAVEEEAPPPPLARLEAFVQEFPGRRESLRESYQRLASAGSLFPDPVLRGSMETYFDSAYAYISGRLQMFREQEVEALRVGAGAGAGGSVDLTAATASAAVKEEVSFDQDNGGAAAVLPPVEEEETKAGTEADVLHLVHAGAAGSSSHVDLPVKMSSEGKEEATLVLNGGEAVVIEASINNDGGVVAAGVDVETRDMDRKTSAYQDDNTVVSMEISTEVDDHDEQGNGMVVSMEISTEHGDDDGDEVSMEVNQHSVQVEDKKGKKAVMDMATNQGAGALVGEIMAETDVKTKRACPEVDGKVLLAGDGAITGKKLQQQQKKRRRQHRLPRQWLVAACEGMQSFDLADIVRRAGRDIRGEFLPALRRARDAPALVLDTVGHLLPAAPRDVDYVGWDNLAALVRCVSAPVLEAMAAEATAAAKMWSAMIMEEEEHLPRSWGLAAIWALVNFVAAYGIAGNLDGEEIMLLHTASDRDGGVELINSLGLADKATDLGGRDKKTGAGAQTARANHR